MFTVGRRVDRRTLVLFTVIVVVCSAISYNGGFYAGATLPTQDGTWTGNAWQRATYGWFTTALHLDYSTAGKLLYADTGKNVTSTTIGIGTGNDLTGVDWMNATSASITNYYLGPTSINARLGGNWGGLDLINVDDMNSTDVFTSNLYANTANVTDTFTSGDVWVQNDTHGWVNATDTLAYPESEADNIIWTDGATPATYYAKNGHTAEVTSNANITTLTTNIITLASGNETIFYKNGLYIFDVKISVNKRINIYGEGWGVIFRNNGTTNGIFDYGDGSQGSIFKNISIDGDKDSVVNQQANSCGVHTNGITGSGKQNIIFENLNIYDCYDTGIGIYNSYGVVVNKCWIHECDINGISVEDSEYCDISNNFIENIDTHVGVTYAKGISSQVDSKTQLYRNNFETNNIYGCHSEALYIEYNYESSIINNKCYLNQDGNTDFAVITINYGSFNIIQKNIVNGSSNNGFLLFNTDKNDLSFNTAVDCDADGIKIALSDSNNLIGDRGDGNGWRGCEIVSGTGNVVINGFYNNNALAEILDTATSTIIKGNQGFVTESSGSSSLTAGNLFVNVTHGLSYTPSAGDIQITLGAGGSYNCTSVGISYYGATYFTVRGYDNAGANKAPSNNITINWTADKD